MASTPRVVTLPFSVFSQTPRATATFPKTWIEHPSFRCLNDLSDEAANPFIRFTKAVNRKLFGFTSGYEGKAEVKRVGPFGLLMTQAV